MYSKNFPFKRYRITTDFINKHIDKNELILDLGVKNPLSESLKKDGYNRGVDYEIMLVPNITNITYGRGVGYVFEEEIFDEDISSISATKIRASLREKGKL